MPSCYYAPNPLYTSEAPAAKFQGVVVVEGIIALDEKIKDPRIVKSPGMGMDESVLTTLKR